MLCLPEPTGPHPVGLTTLHLLDTSRPDPWVPGVDARELLVSVWYPAESASGEPAGYLTPAESELLLAADRVPGVPPDVLSTVRTHARVDAEPARRGLPLVVLSPGFTKPRAVLTSLGEDLASHGFLVAAIDHTYEAAGTSFPDGRVATRLAGAGVPHDLAFWLKLKHGRATDVSFVLDELTRTGWSATSRIAMVGHSVGGASAIPVLLADSRVRAGIDVDGSTDVPIPAGGLAKPFLFLGRQSQYDPANGTPAAASWQRDWPHLTGWKGWFVVAGAAHHSFTDLGLLADQLGIHLSPGLPGARCMEITRGVIRGFLEQHLLDQHLRDRPPPSPTRYPENTVLDWRDG
jgi:predicted dienelactone hydrolase